MELHDAVGILLVLLFLAVFIGILVLILKAIERLAKGQVGQKVKAWDKRFSAETAPVLGMLTLGIIAAVGIFWVIFTFFYAPSHSDEDGHPSIRQPQPGVTTQTSPELAMRLAIVATQLATEDAPPRFELMQGNNLDIYVSTDAWEDLPFPDRPQAMQKIGKAWCDAVNHTFLPVVRIRDIRTGRTFARYSCVLDRASLN